MMMMMREINKQEIFQKLDSLKITKELNMGDIQVVTTYNNRVMKRVNVSKIYEIFDFGSFAKKTFEDLLNRFEISKYNIVISGGVQEMILESDKITIENKVFTKRFYLLSSSDKTRRLQLNFGLYNIDDNFTIISKGVSRKHTNGLNEIVDQVDMFANTVFDEQIELMRKVINETILYSQVRKIILDMDIDDNTAINNAKKSNLVKLKLFNRMLVFSGNGDYGYNRYPYLYGTRINDIPFQEDLELEGYQVFKLYLTLFRTRDSYIIKQETERISKITKRAFREERLSQLLG